MGFDMAGTCDACSCANTTDGPADEATKQAAHGTAQQTAHWETIEATNTTSHGTTNTCAFVAAYIPAQPAALIQTHSTNGPALDAALGPAYKTANGPSLGTARDAPHVATE